MFGLRTLTFGVQTLSLVCEHYVWSANPHVQSANSVFADRTQGLDSERERSQTELGVWTPNVRVRRPNVSVHRPNSAFALRT